MKITIPFSGFKEAVNLFSKQFEAKTKDNIIQVFVPEDAKDSVVLRSRGITGSMRCHIDGAEIDRSSNAEDDGVGEVTGDVMFNLSDVKVKEMIQLGAESEFSYTKSIDMTLQFNIEGGVHQVDAEFLDVGKDEDSDYENRITRSYTTATLLNSDNRDMSFEIPEEDTVPVSAGSILTVLNLMIPKLVSLDGKEIYFGKSFATLHTPSVTFFVRNLVADHIKEFSMVKTTAETLQSVVNYHVNLAFAEADELAGATESEAEELDVSSITIPMVVTGNKVFIKTGSIELVLNLGKSKRGGAIERVLLDTEFTGTFRFRGAVYNQGLNRANLLAGKESQVKVSLTPNSGTLSLNEFNVPMEVTENEGLEEVEFSTTPSLMINSVISPDEEILMVIGEKAKANVLAITSNEGLPEGEEVESFDRLWYSVQRIKLDS